MGIPEVRFSSYLGDKFEVTHHIANVQFEFQTQIIGFNPMRFCYCLHNVIGTVVIIITGGVNRHDRFAKPCL